MSKMPRPTYQNARTEFLNSATSAGFSTCSQLIEGRGIDGGDLKQDYAYKLTGNETTFVHLSGVHGVEGYLGSQIQREYLKNFQAKNLNANCIFVHAVNPYGMSWYRRTNANNVDLNRNGIFTASKSTGENKLPKNPIYADFVDLLTSDSRGQLLSRWPKALLRAVHLGFASVAAYLPAGQYEFPELPFFGGKNLQPELRKLTEQLQKLAPQTKRWVFIDAHSGLGKYAEDLLIVPDDSTASLDFWCRAFAKSELTIVAQQTKVYNSSGMVDCWLTNELGKNGSQVFYMLEDFGTLSGLKVLSHMILENAWFQKNLNSEKRRDLMLSAFYPNQPWAETCTRRGLQVISSVWDQANGN